MTKLVTTTGVRPLMGCVAALALSLVCHSARASVEVLFDLPAQSLKVALEKFDASTNLSVFYSSELAAGKLSAAVHGFFAPQQALQMLLEGTGLTIQSVAPDAFVLVAASGKAGDATKLASSAARYVDGLIQDGIRSALCARPDLALGSYRLAMLVKLDQNGDVEQARLLDTTGNRQRDAAIVTEVRKLHVSQPPQNPEQAFVILIKPQTNKAKPVCTAHH